LVQVVYAYSAAVMMEISLSFLGFGISGRVSLGHMIYQGWQAWRDSTDRVIYWGFCFPMLLVVMVLLGAYLLADGLQRRFQSQEAA
jgi:ABC-type dipeptide/oligopeptide/nickel transport system permease subunit